MGYFVADACPVDRVGAPNACAYPDPPYAGLWVPCTGRCNGGASLFTPEPGGGPGGSTIYRGKTFLYAGWCFTLADVLDPNIGTPLASIPPNTQFPILLDDSFECVTGCGDSRCDQYEDVYVQLQACGCTPPGMDTPRYVCAAQVFEALNAGRCYVIVRQATSGEMVCFQPQFGSVIFGEENLPSNATVYGRLGADPSEYDDCCHCCATWSECERETTTDGPNQTYWTDTTLYPLTCCCDPAQVTGTFSGTYDFASSFITERREGSGVCVGGVWTIRLQIWQNGSMVSDTTFTHPASCNPMNYDGAGGFGQGYFGVTTAALSGDVSGSGTFRATCESIALAVSLSNTAGTTSATTVNLSQSLNSSDCNGRCGQGVGGSGVRLRDDLLDQLETELGG